MSALHRLAAFVLAFEMPVPFYWLVLHGGVEFSARGVPRALAISCAADCWGIGDSLLFHFRAQLLRNPLIASSAGSSAPPVWTIVAGVLLIAADAILLTTVEMELGGHRLWSRN